MISDRCFEIDGLGENDTRNGGFKPTLISLFFWPCRSEWPSSSSSSSAYNIHIKHTTDFPFVFAIPNANNSIRASIIHHLFCDCVSVENGFACWNIQWVCTAFFTHWSQMFDLRKKCKFFSYSFHHICSVVWPGFLFRSWVFVQAIRWSCTIQWTEYQCERVLYGLVNVLVFNLQWLLNGSNRLSTMDDCAMIRTYKRHVKKGTEIRYMDFMQIIANKFYSFD